MNRDRVSLVVFLLCVCFVLFMGGCIALPLENDLGMALLIISGCGATAVWIGVLVDFRRSRAAALERNSLEKV